MKDIEILNKIADKDSIKAECNTDSGITKFYFTVKGQAVEAQSDIDNSGIYGVMLKELPALGIIAGIPLE